jgi:Uma2 family endonuclease
MGMAAQQTDWTAEMARALPEDGNRYEVLDGVLFVSPAPRLDHQAVVLRLAAILDAYVREHSLGWVFISPADIEFSPRRYVQPDIFVVSNTGKGRPRSWREAHPLSLVAEVLSQSTARADRTVKRPTYQSERIPEYWIVDADARLVECWRPEDERPAVTHVILTWRPKEDVPPLEINLPEFFAAALD